MTPEDALIDEARYFVRALGGLKQADVSPDILRARTQSYRPRHGRDFQCPHCWIKDGARSTLRSAPGTDEYDVLRCNYDACAAEFIIPF